MNTRGVCSVLVTALMYLALPQELSLADMSEKWVVVVRPSNPVRTLKRSELDRIYRRTTRFWNDPAALTPALPILPINLPPGDPLREAFSRTILRADDDVLSTWWNRQYFQGVLPPIVLRSAAAVRAYVAATPGAIGYLPPDLVDSSVAVVTVDEGN